MSGCNTGIQCGACHLCKGWCSNPWWDCKKWKTNSSSFKVKRSMVRFPEIGKTMVEIYYEKYLPENNQRLKEKNTLNASRRPHTAFAWYKYLKPWCVGAYWSFRHCILLLPLWTSIPVPNYPNAQNFVCTFIRWNKHGGTWPSVALKGAQNDPRN